MPTKYNKPGARGTLNHQSCYPGNTPTPRRGTLSSDTFRAAKGQAAFLRFVTEEALSGSRTPTQGIFHWG